MKKRLPIGVRLTLRYLLMFACAQAIFGLGMWSILRFNLYDIADDALESQIDDVQHFLEASKPDASVLDVKNNIARIYASSHSGEYLLVTGEQGSVLYRGRLIGENAVPLEASLLRDPVYQDRKIDHRRVRTLTEVLNVGGKRYVAQVGAGEDDLFGTLRLFRRYLLFLAPLLLLVAAAGGFWLSRSALAPVDRLTRAARNITGKNPGNRLEQLHTGDELQRLSDTLNEMLARIEAQFLRVSQFTADASHELRTPVALIRTEAEIALRKSREAPEYRDALQHILLEAEKTSTLIETLLSLARADADREGLVKQPLNLREISQKAAEQWRLTIASKNLQFSEVLGEASLPIEGDEAALNRLLNILLDNAVKYTPAPGIIKLSLETKNQIATIQVEDTGIGISEEDQGRIFERFYRADKARTREFGGAGLGLAIAEWIVQQHQGRISLRSELGKGSTFTVEVPLQNG